MTVLAKLSARKRLRVAGLMSGTSADGVDVAIVDMRGRRITLTAFRTIPYPPSLRKDVLELSNPENARVDDLCRLNFALGEVFASALITVAEKSGIALDTIDLIGSHGQTVCHLPKGRRSGRRTPAGQASASRRKRKKAGWLGSTLQIAEPSVIAERTGITTVADFRPRDMAAGGQGAPLVAYADYILFRHAKKSRAIQNIGGIANVTWLPAGASLADVLAFDTGPGNMAIDAMVHLITRGKWRYDAAGALAGRGSVNRVMLAGLMRHSFLRRKPPKSAGREDFGKTFSDEIYRRAREKQIPSRDVLATVTAFTARSIVEAYRRFLPATVDEVILCGGGAHNRTLVKMLAAELPTTGFLSTGDFDIDPDAKEALSFAVLARETIRGAASNVPSATGARRGVVLGKIIPG